MSTQSTDINLLQRAVISLDRLSVDFRGDALNLYLKTHVSCEKEAFITGIGDIEGIRTKILMIKDTIRNWNEELDNQDEWYRFSTDN